MSYDELSRVSGNVIFDFRKTNLLPKETIDMVKKMRNALKDDGFFTQIFNTFYSDKEANEGIIQRKFKGCGYCGDYKKTIWRYLSRRYLFEDCCGLSIIFEYNEQTEKQYKENIKIEIRIGIDGNAIIIADKDKPGQEYVCAIIKPI